MWRLPPRCRRCPGYMCDPAHPFHLATFSTQQTTNHLTGHERPHARSDEVVHPAQHVGVRLPLSKGDLPARIRDSIGGDQAEKPAAGCVPKATYGSMPIGSGRFRNHAQDFYRVLGMTFSSTCALREEDCEAQTAIRSSVDHR